MLKQKRLYLGSLAAVLLFMVIFTEKTEIKSKRIIRIQAGLSTSAANLSRCTEESYQYHWNGKQGKEFHPNHTALDTLGFPLTEFITLDKELLEDFVFVTASNRTYALAAREGIATIQTHFPSRNIIFYDIGLENPDYITEV